MTKEKKQDHPGARRVENWLIANGYKVKRNGVFDEQTLDAMRTAIFGEERKGEGVGLRHRALLTLMAERMADPDLLTEVYGA